MPTISETEADGWCSFVTDDLPPPSLPASAEIFLILERVKKKAPNQLKQMQDPSKKVKWTSQVEQ